MSVRNGLISNCFKAIPTLEWFLGSNLICLHFLPQCWSSLPKRRHHSHPAPSSTNLHTQILTCQYPALTHSKLEFEFTSCLLPFRHCNSCSFYSNLYQYPAVTHSKLEVGFTSCILPLSHCSSCSFYLKLCQYPDLTHSKLEVHNLHFITQPLLLLHFYPMLINNVKFLPTYFCVLIQFINFLFNQS